MEPKRETAETRKPASVSGCPAFMSPAELAELYRQREEDVEARRAAARERPWEFKYIPGINGD